MSKLQTKECFQFKKNQTKQNFYIYKWSTKYNLKKVFFLWVKVKGQTNYISLQSLICTPVGVKDKTNAGLFLSNHVYMLHKIICFRNQHFIVLFCFPLLIFDGLGFFNQRQNAAFLPSLISCHPFKDCEAWIVLWTVGETFPYPSLRSFFLYLMSNSTNHKRTRLSKNGKYHSMVLLY